MTLITPIKFGNTIKKLRDKKHYSLRQVSQQSTIVGKPVISPSYWSLIERGERNIPKIDTLTRMAKGLGITQEEILNFAGLSLKSNNSKSTQSNFGVRLKSLREHLGKTQDEVSKENGITRATYSHLENNRNEPDLKMLNNLADYFGVTTDYLLGKKRNNQSNIAPTSTTIGCRIKELRKEKHLTQKQLSKLTGFSAQVISNYERDYSLPTAEDIYALSKALNVSISSIYNKNNSKLYQDDLQDMDKLKKRLTNLREQNGWTKTYVSKKLGLLNLGTYANYEYGTREPDLETLKRISALYGVSTDYLIGNEGQSSKNKILDLNKALQSTVPMRFESINLSQSDKEKIQRVIQSIYWDQLHT